MASPHEAVPPVLIVPITGAVGALKKGMVVAKAENWGLVQGRVPVFVNEVLSVKGWLGDGLGGPPVIVQVASSGGSTVNV